MKWIVYQANSHCDIAGYKQTFEDRFGSHKKSFNPIKHKNDTELSTKKKKKKLRNQKAHCNTKNSMENYQNTSFLQFKLHYLPFMFKREITKLQHTKEITF